MYIDDYRISPQIHSKREGGSNTFYVYEYDDPCVHNSAWYYNSVKIKNPYLISNDSMNMIRLHNINETQAGIYEIRVYYCGFSRLYQPSYLAIARSELEVEGK